MWDPFFTNCKSGARNLPLCICPKLLSCQPNCLIPYLIFIPNLTFIPCLQFIFGTIQTTELPTEMPHSIFGIYSIFNIYSALASYLWHNSKYRTANQNSTFHIWNFLHISCLYTIYLWHKQTAEPPTEMSHSIFKACNLFFGHFAKKHICRQDPQFNKPRLRNISRILH